MERLYEAYKKDIEFVIVYIREAHPEMLRKGNKTGIVGRPKDFDQRIILATECVTRYKFTMPMVIDGMAGEVNQDYQAAPVRVTITDLDGKVAYYAGPGPFDFRLSKVDKVLKKLKAGAGRMPPAPPSAWGEAVDGLRLGLSLDPPNPAPGDDVSVLLNFENVINDPVYLYYNSADPCSSLVVKNGKGGSLTLKSPRAGGSRPSRSMMRRGGFRIFPTKLEKGERFSADFDGKLAAADDPENLSGGSFQAQFFFEVNEEMVTPVRRYRDFPYWKGKVASGSFDLSVTRKKKQSCMDCHGVEDYHHIEDRDCAACHTGEPDTEQFTIKEKACSQCHPREGVQGRRMIVGIADQAADLTVHTAGKGGDKTCLRCHDHESHGKGKVSLIYPHSRKRKAWEGSRTEFCLGCHGDSLPLDVTIPESMQSLFDKSDFLSSLSFEEGMECTHCHTIHGSPLPSFVKEEKMESPHR